MTEHVFRFDEMEDPAFPAAICSCGKWRRYISSGPAGLLHCQEDFDQHVRQEADWDAIATALEHAEDQASTDWTDAVAALARLRGRP